MKYTESQKQQLRDFLSEGLMKAAVYMKITMGFPEEIFFEKIRDMQTTSVQMLWLSNFAKEHIKVLEGMPRYNAES